MEDRPKPVIESPVKTEQGPEQSRQRLENIQMRWQRFRAGGSFFETEGDDSKETSQDKKEKSEKRTSRFTKIGSFIRRLSGKEASETDTPTSAETPKPDLEHSHWFGLPTLELTDRPAHTLGSEFEPPKPPEEPERSPVEGPIEQSEQSLNSEAPPPPAETLAGSEPPEGPPEPPEGPRFGEAEEPPEPPDLGRTEHWYTPGGGVATVAPERNEPVREVHTIERLPRRGIADRWARAGLLLEFIGRHRGDRRLDRKHSRAERRIEDQVKRLHQRVDNQERVTPERPWPAAMPTLVESRPAPKYEQVKPPPESKPLPWMRPPAAERQQVTEQTLKPERLETPYKPDKQRVERLTAPEAYHLRPDELQHEVEEAVKKKMAVEAIYERRHEVKDTPPVGAQPVTGSFGGAQRIPAPLFQPQQASSRPTPVWQSQGLLEEDAMPSSDRKLYSTAVKTGFFAAVIIAAVIVVILLLT